MTVGGHNPKAARKDWFGRASVECEGKDKLDAVRAQELARRMREKDRRVDPYHCSFCRCWHVGSKPATAKKALRRKPRPPVDDGGDE